MLNNSGESGHPYLIPDLRGNAFSFSPLRKMFAVGLSYMAFTHSASLHLLVGAFNPFTFKVIIDIYVPIAIVLFGVDFVDLFFF